MAQELEHYNVHEMVFTENICNIQEEYIDDKVTVCETTINVNDTLLLTSFDTLINKINDNIKIENEICSVDDIKIEFDTGPLWIAEYVDEYSMDNVKFTESTSGIGDDHKCEGYLHDSHSQSIGEDGIKIEISSSEPPDHMINDHVKLEDEIDIVDEVKIECSDNRSSLCGHCGTFCDGCCTKCEMPTHTLSKDSLPVTDNEAQTQKHSAVEDCTKRDIDKPKRIVEASKCGVRDDRCKPKKSLKMQVEEVHISDEEKRAIDHKVERVKHVKDHVVQARYYKCETCTTFETHYKVHLERHVKTVHLEEFDHICDRCDYKTNNKFNFDSHVKTTHRKEYTFKCDSCEYATNKRLDLKNHVKAIHLEEFDYKCALCQYKTNKNSHFRMHMKLKHLGECDYRCDKCPYKTNHKSELGIHVKAVHLKEFQYVCEVCAYRTNRRALIERHTKTKHIAECDYKCASCQYQTNRKEYLVSHVKTKHLKEFSSKCEFCDYAASNMRLLKNHVKTKHFKEFDYKCARCEFQTNYKASLECHVKKLHLEV